MHYKKRLIEHLVSVLEETYQNALASAQRAHSTATDKANIAENKYDTLGLEAAYLAEGQANRASQCKANVNAAKNLSVVDYTVNDAICVGAFISLVDHSKKTLSLFLAPVSGGVKFVFEGQTIVVITQSSPLGKQLLGKYLDDEFEMGNGQHKKSYTITGIA